MFISKAFRSSWIPVCQLWEAV